MLTARLMLVLFTLLCCVFAAPLPSEQGEDDDCGLRYCDIFGDICKNGGKCVNTDCKNGQCECPPGLTGHLCDTFVMTPKSTTVAPRYIRKRVRPTRKKTRMNSLILRLFKTLAHARSAPEQEREEEKTNPPTTPTTTTTTRPKTTTPPTTTTTTTTTRPTTTTPPTTRRSTTTTTPTTTPIPTTTSSTSTTTMTTTAPKMTTMAHSTTRSHLQTTPLFGNATTLKPTTIIPSSLMGSGKRKVIESEDAPTLNEVMISSDHRKDYDRGSTPLLITLYASEKPNNEGHESVSTAPTTKENYDRDIEDSRHSASFDAKLPVRLTMQRGPDEISTELELHMKVNNDKPDNGTSSDVSQGVIHAQTQGNSNEMNSRAMSEKDERARISDSKISSTTQSSNYMDEENAYAVDNYMKDITEDNSKELSGTASAKHMKDISSILKAENESPVPGIVPLKTLKSKQEVNNPLVSTEKIPSHMLDSKFSNSESMTLSTSASSIDIAGNLKNHSAKTQTSYVGHDLLDSKMNNETSTNSSKEIILPPQSLPNKTLSYLKSFTQQFLETVMSKFDSPSLQNGSIDDRAPRKENPLDTKTLTNFSNVFDETANATDESNSTMILFDDLDTQNSTIIDENFASIDIINVTNDTMANESYSELSSQPTMATKIMSSASTIVPTTPPQSNRDMDKKTIKDSVSTTRAPRVHIIEPAHLGIKMNKDKNDRMSVSARITGLENSLTIDSDAKNTDIGVEKHIHNLYLNFEKNRESGLNRESKLGQKSRIDILNSTPSNIIDISSDNSRILESENTLLTTTVDTLSTSVTNINENVLSENEKDNVVHLPKLSTVSSLYPQQVSIPSKSSLPVDSDNSFV